MAPILLTGWSGYFGACIAAELRMRGVAFQALPVRLEQISPRSLDASLVIHAAGALRHRSVAADIVNRGGTERLLAGLTRRTPVVFASSRSVYGRATSAEPLSEAAPVAPLDAYGRSKADAERLIVESGHPHLILRLSTLIGYGAGGAGRSFHTQAARRLLAGEPVALYTPDRPHDFLPVRAAAFALVTAALAMGREERATCNLAGEPASLHRLLEELATAAAAAGLQPELRPMAGPPSAWPLLDAGAFHGRYGRPPTQGDLAGELVACLAAELRGAHG